MKKIFFAFAILISVVGKAQINVPHSIKVIAAESNDWKYGPWATTAAAKTAVPLGIRTGGLTVYINSCSCEYHWLDTDLSDSGLIIKVSGGSGWAVTGTTNLTGNTTIVSTGHDLYFGSGSSSIGFLTNESVIVNSTNLLNFTSSLGGTSLIQDGDFKINRGTGQILLTTAPPQLDTAAYVLGIKNSNNSVVKIKKSTISGGGSTDTTSLSKRIDYKQTVFNVKLYGAKGDSSQNDGPAILRAIAAACSAGGGIVYFPSGIYRDDDAPTTTYGNTHPNAQIYFPVDSGVIYPGHNKAITIKLMGDVAASFSESALARVNQPHTGSVIQSTITNSSGSLRWILGTHGPVTNSYYNAIDIEIENMTFRTNGQSSKMSGVDLEYFSNSNFHDSRVDAGTSITISTLPKKTIGLKSVKTGGGSSVVFNNSFVVGYYYGYVMGEHSTGNNVQALGCWNGFSFTHSDHASHFDRMLTHWCVNDISVYPPEIGSGIALVIDEFDVEAKIDSKWYDHVNSINDSLNKFNGVINYYQINTGGATTTFTGAGLITITDLLAHSTVAPSTSTDPLNIIGSNSNRSTITSQNNNSAGNGSFIVKNNSGFSSYGDFLAQGSSAAGTFLGVANANRTFLISDGGSSAGLAIGTLTSDPLTFGTNDTKQMEIASGGTVTVTSLVGTGTRLVTADASGDLGTSTFSAANLIDQTMQAGGRNLTSGDNGTIITTSNSSPITITVVSGLPIGFHCTVIQGQSGTGTVIVSAGSGVTAYGTGTTAAQGDAIEITHFGTSAENYKFRLN